MVEYCSFVLCSVFGYLEVLRFWWLFAKRSGEPFARRVFQRNVCIGGRNFSFLLLHPLGLGRKGTKKKNG